MNGREFLETAHKITVEFFPNKVSQQPINLNEQEIEAIISELETRTGYVRRAEFRSPTL